MVEKWSKNLKKSLSIKLDHVWKKNPDRWKSPLKVEIPRHIINGNNRFLKSFIIANCYNNIFGYLKRLKHYKHLNIMKYLKIRMWNGDFVKEWWWWWQWNINTNQCSAWSFEHMLCMLHEDWCICWICLDLSKICVLVGIPQSTMPRPMFVK